MEHCHANQSLGCSTRGAASLLPLLQRALRDAQHRSELCLRQPSIETRLRDGRAGLNGSPLATAGFEFTNAVQYLLPDVALGFCPGEGACCQFLSHVRTTPSVVSE